MKSKTEARVLASKCFSEVCVGLILRGSDVDGAVSGRDCAELCSDLEKRGFSGELRFSTGDCKCGFPTPDRVSVELISVLHTFSASLPLWVTRTRVILAEKYNTPRNPHTMV